MGHDEGGVDQEVIGAQPVPGRRGLGLQGGGALDVEVVAGRRWPSETKPPFLEAAKAIGADDDVIEAVDAEQLARLHDLACDVDVFGGRVRGPLG